MRYIMIAVMFVVACAVVPFVDSVDNGYAEIHHHTVVVSVGSKVEAVIVEADNTETVYKGKVRVVSIQGVFARLYNYGEEDEPYTLS